MIQQTTLKVLKKVQQEVEETCLETQTSKEVWHLMKVITFEVYIYS
jgi:hypothetical protein